MTNRNLTCDALDAVLADYLEGTLGDSRAADVELHLSGCVRCTSVVRGLESIANEAASLPALVPSRDLWPAISARIDTPVIQLAPRSAPGPQLWHRIRMGSIAAGLMAVSALTTYWLTRQQAPAAVAVAPATDAPGTASQKPGSGNTGPDSALAPVREVVVATGAPAIASSPAQSAVPVASRERADARTIYNTEIARLRGVLSLRADELDPTTVAIIESSINTIDTAIAEARAALSRDPASRFLSSQLDKVLEKKLGVLRTAALLPAQT